MLSVLAAAFCVAFAISVVCALIIRRVAAARGFVDRPGGRKAHVAEVPLGGGIAILAGTALPVLGAGLLSWLWTQSPSLIPLPEQLQEDVGLAAQQLLPLLAVLAGGAAAAAMGLWDDLRDLGPALKLCLQLAIAVGVALVPDLRITLFIRVPWLHVVVTTLWIVLMMNSFNLLDNMDGQSGLVAFLTGGAMLILALETHQYFVAGLLLCLIGAVLGFLLFNLPPASLFMGDAGSMFLGYMLAVATSLTTFMAPGRANPLFPLLVPLVIFAIPLYDTLTVVAIRLSRRRPVMQGDRSHFSHRLIGLGMSERRVLLTVGLTVVATSLGATIPYGSSTWRIIIPAVQALAVMLVILQLELAGNGPRRGA